LILKQEVSAAYAYDLDSRQIQPIQGPLLERPGKTLKDYPTT